MGRTYVTNAMARQTATIIFLHGLGDTGAGWTSQIGAIKPPNVKSICPTADVMPVTLNGGFPMPSWFDLYSLEADASQDEAGIERAKVKIHQLIAEEEKTGIPCDRIMLGGFSQGGALALYSGLTYPKKLAGIIALSCWMPMSTKVSTTGPNWSSPILQCHGDMDPIVPLRWGEMTRDFLKKHVGNNYSFKVYHNLPHSSNDEEMRDAKKFLQDNIA